MRKPRTFFGLSPDQLLACARECRAAAAKEASPFRAASTLRQASQYEALARRLGGHPKDTSKTITVWERRGRTFVALAEARDGAVDFFLIVDPKPNRRWHWSVWRRGRAPLKMRHGVANAVQDAMRRAERTAETA